MESFALFKTRPMTLFCSGMLVLFFTSCTQEMQRAPRDSKEDTADAKQVQKMDTDSDSDSKNKKDNETEEKKDETKEDKEDPEEKDPKEEDPEDGEKRCFSEAENYNVVLLVERSLISGSTDPNDERSKAVKQFIATLSDAVNEEARVSLAFANFSQEASSNSKWQKVKSDNKAEIKDALAAVDTPKPIGAQIVPALKKASELFDEKDDVKKSLNYVVLISNGFFQEFDPPPSNPKIHPRGTVEDMKAEIKSLRDAAKAEILSVRLPVANLVTTSPDANVDAGADTLKDIAERSRDEGDYQEVSEALALTDVLTKAAQKIAGCD